MLFNFRHGRKPQKSSSIFLLYILLVSWVTFGQYMSAFVSESFVRRSSKLFASNTCAYRCAARQRKTRLQAEDKSTGKERVLSYYELKHLLERLDLWGDDRTSTLVSKLSQSNGFKLKTSELVDWAREEKIVVPVQLRVVGCSNLPKCDLGGLSPGDPYVEVKLAGACSVLDKTKVVRSSVDPRWDHHFYMSHYTVGQHLELVVKDYDFLDKHDILGRVTLDPVDFFPDGIKRTSVDLEGDCDVPPQGQIEYELLCFPFVR